MLEALEKAYAEGDASALWRAILHCARFKEPLPEWVCEALERAALRDHLGQLGSYDKVFGKPKTKGQAERAEADHYAALEIGELASEAGRNEGWFEVLGRRRLASRVIGKSKVKELLAYWRQLPRGLRSK